MKDTTFKKPNVLEYVDQKMKEGYSEDEALFLYDVEFSDVWESEEYEPEDDPAQWDV